MSTFFQKLISNSAVYGFGSAVQSLSMFLVIPIITLNSSTEEFGTYGILIGFSSILTGIFYLGITSALPRFYFEKTDKRYRNSVFFTGLIIVSVGAIIQFLLVNILWSFNSFHLTGSMKLTSEIIIYFALNNSLLIINPYLMLIFRLNYNARLFVMLNIFYALIVYTLINVYLPHSEDALLSVFKYYFYSNLCLFSGCVFYLLRQDKISPTVILERLYWKNILIFGFFSIIASFGQTFVDTIDRFFIGGSIGLVESGTYFSYTRVSALIYVLFCVPFSLVWSSLSMEIMNLNYRNNLIQVTLTIYFLLGIWLVLAVSLFVEPIFSLLIRNYESTFDYVLFYNLASAVIVLGALPIISVGLFYDQQINRLAATFYIGVFFKILLLYFFEKWLTLRDYGIIHFVTNTLILVSCHLITKPSSRVLIDWRAILVILMSFCICLGFLTVHQNALSFIDRFALLVTISLACLAIIRKTLKGRCFV